MKRKAANAMDPLALVDLIVQAKGWIAAQRDRFRAISVSIPQESHAVLAPFFDASTLEAARVTLVPVIDNLRSIRR